MVDLKGVGTKAGNFAAKVVIRLAQDKVVDDTIDELLVYFNQTTPQQILNLATSNSTFSMVPEEGEDRARWEKRIRAGARAARKFGKVDLARNAIRDIKPLTIYEGLIRKAGDEEMERAIGNLAFMANTPVAIKWYGARVEEVKAWVLTKFDFYVAQQPAIPKQESVQSPGRLVKVN